jgi:hypothetical protein
MVFAIVNTKKAGGRGTELLAEVEAGCKQVVLSARCVGRGDAGQKWS